MKALLQKYRELILYVLFGAGTVAVIELILRLFGKA